MFPHRPTIAWHFARGCGTQIARNTMDMQPHDASPHGSCGCD
jgi:hypothetical protein